jgi:hypothetical protein
MGVFKQGSPERMVKRYTRKFKLLPGVKVLMDIGLWMESQRYFETVFSGFLNLVKAISSIHFCSFRRASRSKAFKRFFFS